MNYSGRYPVAFTCEEHLIDAYGLKESYRKLEETENCSIFSDPKAAR